MRFAISVFLLSACLCLSQQSACADMPAIAWTNSIRPLDVDNDGLILSGDASLIIDDLNIGGARTLPALVSPPTLYLDTNGDDWVSPIDALTVIHHVASRSSSPVPEPGSLLLLLTALCAATPVRRRLQGARDPVVR